ncbi:hypothetical protein FNF29_06138 [Cafeteria roenbergensis]|uniref:Uncharacterized protein n=1 Tax=Cafeteria roenbergensis TaxID=33653 RepID=A0A5A8CBS5_CAFRO|nr:hypothetical protein FNF29_06138 [Cafeteria roenbergensis]|eukprot:KAA0149251.1 hypothetical protein FNF29_06138 [Cafeteria roenbergensis]
MGGASPEDIGDHFCNELSKREIGRRRCLAGGCHAFMSIDADEFYARAQLAEAARAMWRGGHDVVTCRMRTFMVDPTWELRPHDDTSRVAALMRCHPHMPFRLCVPTSMLVDPTRRLLRASRVLDLPRARLEMHHMSLVRRSLRSKFSSVSNRANYPQGAEAAARSLEAWAPDKGPVVHPHPAARPRFDSVVVVPNHFGIRVHGTAGRGSRLRQGARYSGGKLVGHESAADAEGVASALRMPASWADSLALPAGEWGPDGVAIRARADGIEGLRPL